MKLKSVNREDYLACSHYIDYEDPDIKKLAADLAVGCQTRTEIARNIFHYVRDQIRHTLDIKGSKVTAAASEVLAEGHGICYSKVNLFAALLRSRGIPAGFCYQRLILGETPDTGYCIHALSGVYIEEIDRWIRLDTRGNKEGVNARFSLEEEYLAFPARAEYGEKDYDTIYPEPLDIIINTLKNNKDAMEMCMNSLPAEL